MVSRLESANSADLKQHLTELRKKDSNFLSRARAMPIRKLAELWGEKNAHEARRQCLPCSTPCDKEVSRKCLPCSTSQQAERLGQATPDVLELVSANESWVFMCSVAKSCGSPGGPIPSSPYLVQSFRFSFVDDLYRASATALEYLSRSAPELLGMSRSISSENSSVCWWGTSASTSATKRLKTRILQKPDRHPERRRAQLVVKFGPTSRSVQCALLGNRQQASAPINGSIVGNIKLLQRNSATLCSCTETTTRTPTV